MRETFELERAVVAHELDVAHRVDVSTPDSVSQGNGFHDFLRLGLFDCVVLACCSNTVCAFRSVLSWRPLLLLCPCFCSLMDSVRFRLVVRVRYVCASYILRVLRTSLVLYSIHALVSFSVSYVPVSFRLSTTHRSLRPLLRWRLQQSPERSDNEPVPSRAPVQYA